jgi:hypothetical protein
LYHVYNEYFVMFFIFTDSVVCNQSELSHICA